MIIKPTYEELEELVNSLEKEIGSCNKQNDSIKFCKKYLEAILDNANVAIFLKDASFKYIFMNRQLGLLAHTDYKTVKGKTDSDFFPDEVAKLFRMQDETVLSQKKLVEFEETITLPDGIQSFMTAKFPLVDEAGKVYAIGGVCTDITARKRAEAGLHEIHETLEELVTKRTQQLKHKTESLEEANIALKVLLEKRDEAKKEDEEKMKMNIEKLIYPYLEKLKTVEDKKSRNSLLEVILANLENITSSFMYLNKNSFAKLTPAQIQIADMIKQGRTSKEIAALLNLSPLTISRQRQEIRKKFNLTNKKVNLQSALASFG